MARLYDNTGAVPVPFAAPETTEAHMALAAPKRMAFEDFAEINGEGRYELVNGELEKVPVPKLKHGSTGYNLAGIFRPYLKRHQPGAVAGLEVDIPTIPFYGRRPDFLYYSPGDAAVGADLAADRITGRPTLVVEVLSEDDESRDLVVKRREYAQAGIPHYWIIDPIRRTILALRLAGKRYQEVGQFAGSDVLTSELFPGLEIPLAEVFDWQR